MHADLFASIKRDKNQPKENLCRWLRPYGERHPLRGRENQLVPTRVFVPCLTYRTSPPADLLGRSRRSAARAATRRGTALATSSRSRQGPSTRRQPLCHHHWLRLSASAPSRGLSLGRPQQLSRSRSSSLPPSHWIKGDSKSTNEPGAEYTCGSSPNQLTRLRRHGYPQASHPFSVPSPAGPAAVRTGPAP